MVLERQGHTFVDLYYPEVMADPVGTLQTLYARLGLEISNEFEDRVREYLNLDSRGNKKVRRCPRRHHHPCVVALTWSQESRPKSRGHNYTLATFGLDAEMIRTDLAFAEYLSKHPRCCCVKG